MRNTPAPRSAQLSSNEADLREFVQDEGGLRPPPGLSAWRRMWWWFDFLVLVKLARLRFVAILVVIGLIITKWELINAFYEKWTRGSASISAVSGDSEYFCPMHPSVVRDNSKEKCPICFMPLSKRKKGETTTEPLPDGVVSRVQLSPYRIVLSGLQSWAVDYVELTKEIAAVGTVEFNERGQTTVSARMAGRIDNLIANETGQMVTTGDVLASIYSPELVVTIQNLLQAKKLNNNALLKDARTRLELLDISADQIEEILESGEANTHLEIRSPMSGHVIRKYVRAGQYVEEGTPLYDLVDLSTVWIQAQIYEDDTAFLPLEQLHGGEIKDGPEVVVTTRAFPDETFQGRLTFVYPHVDEKSRTLAVRFELPNPGHKLRPGSTASVKLRIAPNDVPIIRRAIQGDNSEASSQLVEGKLLAVPDGAVIDTGTQQIVYRETLPGVYEGVQVKLGPRMFDAQGTVYYPVLDGLGLRDAIVTSGSFLVDAETRLNPSAGSIYFGGSSGTKNSGQTAIRGTTPEDPEAKIDAALAKLPPDERKQAESQKFCPILRDSRLGSMGVPIKVTLNGRNVFLCCNGCKDKALKNPDATLLIVDESIARKQNSQPELTTPSGRQVNEEKGIAEELAKLPDQDRELAIKQWYCPIAQDSRLGSMGVPIKLVIKGKPVFLCCEGCENEAKGNPDATLDRVRELLAEPAKDAP